MGLFNFFGKNKKEGKREIVKIDDLTVSNVVHEGLTNEQMKRIKNIHETFLEVYPISLEDTITNFKRDRNPDNEIAIWQNMTLSYKSFIIKNNEAHKLEKRKEAFKLLLMRTMMSDEEAIKSSGLKILSEEDIREILDFSS